MMTFKQFYLLSSKGAKAPPRASKLMNANLRNKIGDRLPKLKATKRVPG